METQTRDRGPNATRRRSKLLKLRGAGETRPLSFGLTINVLNMKDASDGTTYAQRTKVG